MKKRLLAVAAALSLLLCGCSAMLERDYLQITPHTTNPTAEGDPSVLKAESYQELVNALMYFITQGAATGAVRLYWDKETIEGDLEKACLEVIQEDPLGAYAVDYIKYSVNPMVSYSEADVQITYRRTREQVASIVSATGTAAIRSELETALAAFAPERVLRISYFDRDEEYIRALCREAYLATPATALDMPEVTVSIDPDQGRQRIVEIGLTYRLDSTELEHRRDTLARAIQALTQPLSEKPAEAKLSELPGLLADTVKYDPAAGSTAYHALVEGSANSQGLALALASLCESVELNSLVVSGEWNGLPHFWIVLQTQAGWRHLDPTENGIYFGTDNQAAEAGYSWSGQNIPACTAAPR